MNTICKDALVTCTNNYVQTILVRKDYSPHTKSSYCISVTHFVRFLENLDDKVIEITLSLMDDYIESMNGYSPGTISQRINISRKYLDHLVSFGHLSHNPLVLLRYRNSQHRIPNFVTEDMLDRLIETAKAHITDTVYGTKHYLCALRNYCMLEVLISTGVTASELVNIRIQDLDVENWSIKIKCKIYCADFTIDENGHYYRTVFLGKPASTVIKDWLSYKHYLVKSNKIMPIDILFITQSGNKMSTKNVWSIIRAQGNRIHFKVCPRQLRNTFAYLLINRGINIRYLQALMGHRSIKSTDRYSCMNFLGLKRELEKFHVLHRPSHSL